MFDAEGGYRSFLRDLGQEYPKVVVIDAGLATSMQTDLFQDAFPERYFNLGIAEQNAVGVASGLSRRGFIPLVHSFSNFLARRAHDQIALSVAWPHCNVKLIAGSCGVFDGRNGPSHTAIDDLATMLALPGMTIIEPGDQAQTRSLLFQMTVDEGPVYFRLRRHGAANRLVQAEEIDTGTLVLQTNPNSAVTLVACGSMLEEAICAAEILKTHDILIDLIHVSYLRPLKSDVIVSSAKKTGLIMTVENHVISGGFGDAIALSIGPFGIRHIRLALPNEFLPAGDPKWLLSYCGLDARNIVSRIIQALNIDLSEESYA